MEKFLEEFEVINAEDYSSIIIYHISAVEREWN